MTIKMKLLATAAAVAMLSGAAQAADAPAPYAGWSGFYVGVTGGYGWGSADSNIDVYQAGTSNWWDDGSWNADVDGAVLGGQIGYDWDLGNSFVVGLAGDMSWTDMNSKTCVEGGGCDGSPDDSYAKAEFDWLSTVRTRVGVTTGSMLFYATGGLAIASVNGEVTNVDGLGDNRSQSDTRYGWVIGAGTEFKVTENISLGAEYLHADLGSMKSKYLGDPNNASDIDIYSKTDLSADIVRASLNFRF